MNFDFICENEESSPVFPNLAYTVLISVNALLIAGFSPATPQSMKLVYQQTYV